MIIGRADALTIEELARKAATVKTHFLFFSSKSSVQSLT
jgi:hypothetical protein